MSPSRDGYRTTGDGVLSSNVLSDVERVCEHVVILANGRVCVAGDIDELERTHFLVIGPRKVGPDAGAEDVVDVREAERQTVRLVRGAVTGGGGDGTVTRPATLEEVVLGYLRSSRGGSGRNVVVTWRQHRIALVGLLVVATVFAVAIALVASFAQRTRNELGIDTCVPNFFGFGDPNNCNRLFTEWSFRVGILRYLTYGLYLIPAPVGSYLGGPLLARELERGTHRLAWTQGIGRVRGAATILGVVLTTTVAAGIVLSLGGHQSWPLLGVTTFRPFDMFDLEGPALVSYLIFGLALGAFVGAWRRRILSGMFFGLIAFALVRGVVMIDLRPYYEPPIAVPLAATFTFGAQAPIPADAWTFGADAVDSQGRTVRQERVRELSEEFVRRGCPAARN